jgi:hypothetical protein
MQEEFPKKNLINKILEKAKNNFKLLIAILVIILTILSVLFFLDYKKNKKNILISEQYNYASILINNEKKNEAKKLLEDIIILNDKTYSPLALYLIIDKKLENESKKITILFDKVLNIKSLKKEEKNLINIKKSLHLLNESKYEEAIDILNTLINSKSIWRETAIKLIAEYYNSIGEKIKAKEYFELLTN